MTCQNCKKSLFKEKLGRCKFCMWLNFGLLITTAIAWFIRYQFAPTEVETIALLLTFIASVLLMSLHIGAYCYYRLQGVKHPTQDKHILK